MQQKNSSVFNDGMTARLLQLTAMLQTGTCHIALSHVKYPPQWCGLWSKFFDQCDEVVWWSGPKKPCIRMGSRSSRKGSMLRNNNNNNNNNNNGRLLNCWHTAQLTILTSATQGSTIYRRVKPAKLLPHTANSDRIIRTGLTSWAFTR